MSDRKQRTIRMTDEEHRAVLNGAKERGLPIGEYICEVCNKQSQEISPEVMCRILTIRELARVPMDQWNDKIKDLYDDCVEGLCALLK